MKKCPFCAEEIQDAAIKCKHCGEFLNGYTRPPPVPVSPQTNEQSLPWYYRTAFILLMLASVGPFALPLIWFRPKTSLTFKVLVSIAVIALTWVLMKATLQSVHVIQDFYKMMGV